MCEVFERLHKFVMLGSFTEATELFSMRDKCIIPDICLERVLPA